MQEYAAIVQRAAAIIGSAIFLVIAPGTLAVYVPWYLTHWHFAPPLFPFARFALQGLGTPAPVMPPKRLVVTGFFRYVRNPIYIAVTALIAASCTGASRCWSTARSCDSSGAGRRIRSAADLPCWCLRPHLSRFAACAQAREGKSSFDLLAAES